MRYLLLRNMFALYSFSSLLLTTLYVVRSTCTQRRACSNYDIETCTAIYLSPVSVRRPSTAILSIRYHGVFICAAI